MKFYTHGDFLAFPVGLEPYLEYLIYDYESIYLGSVLPSTVWHSAFLYNRALLDVLLFEKSALYIVEPEDSLRMICERFEIGIADLVAMNLSLDPRTLKAGEVLRVVERE